MQDKSIVVVGGGFAGTTLVRALERCLPADWQLVLISEESYTTFNPMLPEVVGAAVFPEHVIAPLRPMLRRTRFIMGRLERVDRAARRLSCATLTGRQELGYAHLVLAFGTRANIDILPGMAEHGLPLKLVGDAMHIRNKVLQRLASIELCEEGSAARREHGHVVVVGGGFSGVEVAGALADFMRDARRYYPGIRDGELAVTLLHDGSRLLPELPAPLGLAAQRSLMLRGVDVRVGAKVVQVDGRRAVLADGTVLRTATVVCTVGARANPVVAQLALPCVRGRIRTLADCAVDEARDLWALGDCAAVPNASDAGISPPTAQFAVAQAGQLAANLVAHLQGHATRAFHYRSKGMMATTGHHKGVAEAFGVHLSGLPAWLLWRAYYLSRMPTFGRKLRIWVEWTWSLFCPADITHLRFTRTHEVDQIDQTSPSSTQRQEITSCS
jgi:NADH dehydrogenase